MDGSKQLQPKPRQQGTRIRTSGTTKDAIAVATSEKVSELLLWLPRKRRIWENDQCSIAIFEAAVLVMPRRSFRSNRPVLTGA